MGRRTTRARGRAGRVFALACVLHASSTGISRAQPRPDARDLDLDLAACGDIDEAQVRKIVAVELRARQGSATSGAAARVTVVCDEAGATISIAGPGAGNPNSERARAVPLAATAPIARARLLALAIAELVSTPAPQPPPPPPGPPVTPPRPAPEASTSTSATASPAPTTRGSLRLLALAAGRSWPTKWPALGAGLRLHGDASARFGWFVDTMLDRGSARVAPGTASIDSVGLGAAALLCARPARWTLGAGLGARGGVVRMTGTPADAARSDGRTVTAPSWGPMLVATLSPPPLGRVALGLSVEAGYVVLPVGGYAGTVRSVAVEGIWIGASLGAGVSF